MRYLIMMVAFLCAGCVGQVRVDSQWQPAADRKQSFDRVLVVGLSANYNVRCEFESFMKNQLRNTAEATASCLYMKSDEPLTRENIERIIAEYQPDAVLTTALVDSSVGAVDGGSSDTRGAGYYKATDLDYEDPYYYDRRGYYGGYGAWGVPVVYVEFQVAPVVTTVEGEITILSMLYETRGAALVYDLTTSAKNLHSRDDALSTITSAIGAQLRRDGVINRAEIGD